FGALGAGAQRTQVHVVALGTVVRQALGMPAMVAAQLMVALMHGHARVAARALADPATVLAEQRRREAAPVEEYQHLLTCLQRLAHGLLQRAGDAAVQWQAFYIQTQKTGRLSAAGALGQLEQRVAAGASV